MLRGFFALLRGNGDPIQIVMNLVVLIFIVAVILPMHEMAHGIVANWLGDPTAKRSGRLTLNPLAHLDTMGTLALVLIGYGWAKPVPVNPYNFKNRKAGMALTALAGPVSNLIAAFVGMLLWEIFLPAETSVLYQMFALYVYINIGLAIFNLLPFPPLDGSRILALLVPDRYMEALYRFEQYGMILIAILIFSGVLSGPLGFLQSGILQGMDWITRAIVGIFR